MKIDNFKIEDWFNKYEKSAKYNMADTCVESLSLNDLFNIVGNEDKSVSELFSKKLNYGDIQGSERLHSAIRDMYNGVMKPITVTHGAIGANNLVMKSLVDSGDDVVVIVPAYQQHYSVPKALGANVKLVYLKEKFNWGIDFNELEAVVTKDTKLICMTNPNNPTGSVLSDNDMLKIVNIAKENDCYILCDEVYRGLEHNNRITKSVVELYEKGISTGSMSKVFSLAGIRLGWIVAPCNVMEKIIIHREYDTISVSILDDYIASVALENKTKIIARNISKILEGKKIISDWIKSEPLVSWIEPNGGTTCLLKYNLDIKSVDLCEKLFKDTGVLFLPGSTLETEGYIRAGFCSDISKLKDGLNIFSKWLIENKYKTNP